MPSLPSAETLAKLYDTFTQVFGVAFKYSFIPIIAYLGLQRGADQGMPKLSFMK